MQSTGMLVGRLVAIVGAILLALAAVIWGHAQPAAASSGGAGYASCSSNENCMVWSYSNSRWIEHRRGGVLGAGALVASWSNTGGYYNRQSNHGAGSQYWNVYAEYIYPGNWGSYCDCFTTYC